MLKIQGGHINSSLSISSGWAKFQWVMIYLFSDETANKYGFGAYAPGVGAEYFEQSASGTFNMDTFAGSYKMRMGTKNDDSLPVSNLRKMLIFKGTAIHSSSSHTIDNLLTSKQCSR